MTDIYINHKKFLKFPEIKGKDIKYKTEAVMAEPKYKYNLTESEAITLSKDGAAATVAEVDDIGDLTEEQLEAIILSSLRLDIA